MKERGVVYTTVGAALALAMLAMVAYTGLSAVEEQRIAGYSNTLLETKRMSQNARIVLDKSASDALFNHVILHQLPDGNCNADLVTTAEAQALVKSYFNSNLAKMGKAEFGEVACRMDEATFDYTYIGTDGARIEVAIECSHVLERSGEIPFSVSYSKEMVFEKRVDVADPPPACIVTVTDIQSGETDISNAD